MKRTVVWLCAAPVVFAGVVLSGCAEEAHDVSCVDFVGMTGADQGEVVESFLDAHPIGRLTFGEDEAQQVSLATMSLNAYCMQHGDTNITDLEPDLIPGL